MKIIALIITKILELKNKICETQNSPMENFWSNYFCLPLFILSINNFIEKIFYNSENFVVDKFYWLSKNRTARSLWLVVLP